MFVMDVHPPPAALFPPFSSSPTVASMSSFSSSFDPFSSASDTGDSGAVPLPSNSRQSSLCDGPIIDPDFWFDSYPPFSSSAAVNDFLLDNDRSSRQAGAGRGGSSWYDGELSAGGGGGGGSAPQPQHGLAPIIPPGRPHAASALPPPDVPHRVNYAQHQQRLYPERQQLQQQQSYQPQHQHPPLAPYNSKSGSQPVFAAAHPLYGQQQHPSFPGHPSHPPHPATVSSSPYTGSPLCSPFAVHTSYQLDSASPVSHASSLSPHSSSGSHEHVKQESGSAPHKRKSSHEGLLNGNEAAEQQQMRDVGDEAEAGGKKKGRGKGGKKQKQQQEAGEQPQRKSSLPSPVLSPTTTAAGRGRKKSVSAATASVASTPSPSDASSASSAASTFSASAPGTSPTASLSSAPLTPNSAGSSDVTVCGLNLNGPGAGDSWFVNQSTFQQVVQTFRTVILSASALTASNTTDIICLLAHMMEVMPEQNLSMLLRILGYSPQPVSRQDEDPTWDGLEKKTQWRAPYSFLPFVTLPRRFRLNWSVSAEAAAPEDQTVINFPTLLWYRPRELSFVRRGDVIIGLEMDREREKEAEKEAASSSPSSAAAECCPLQPSEIDMALLELPCRVEVNASFERMFGYSQSEIKTLFVRHGKQALSRLADPTQLRRIHTQDLQGMCDGQNEFTHVIDINTKYGSGMRTIMHHKLVIGESGMVCKKIYQWIPVPAALRKLEELAAAKDKEPVPTAANSNSNKTQ